jgi:ketosteroid isomerase-like protein
MSTTQHSPAVAIARAHVEAWSSQDFDKARSLLAPDVRVTATTTAPYPPDTDLSGVDSYMAGLVPYAEPIVPGSLRFLDSVGDDTNALLTLKIAMAGGPFGEGVEAPCARLYLIEDGKIKTEKIVFYIAAN